MTVVSILMLSPPVNIRMTSNLTFQGKIDQHSKSYHSEVRDNIPIPMVDHHKTSHRNKTG